MHGDNFLMIIVFVCVYLCLSVSLSVLFSNEPVQYSNGVAGPNDCKIPD